MPTVTLHDDDRSGEWDPLIGSTVGSWRIAKKLGQGGMGAVFLARHPGIGSKVAMKFLHARYLSDRGAVERFFNEARAVNLIGHENIVKIHDFNVTSDGRRYFVMEFLEGRPLAALVEGKKAVPLAVAGPILLQVCRALQAAHERGITHRDLKPDNIFLVAQMGKKHFVKLVDFGIAKLEPQGARQGAVTEAGVVMGTPAYMSPEQAAGRVSEIGARSDVYSLGVVMYQLATGRLPLEGPSTAETLVMHLQQKPLAPRTIEPGVPEAYEQVILKALEKRREDRFQSMRELQIAIEACMSALGISSELPIDDTPKRTEGPGEEGEESTRTLDGKREERRGVALPVPDTQTVGQPSDRERAEERLHWLFAPERRIALFAGAVVVMTVVVGVLVRGMPRETRTPTPTQTQTQTRTPTQPPAQTPTQPPTQPPTQVPAPNKPIAAPKDAAPTPPHPPKSIKPPAQQPPPKPKVAKVAPPPVPAPAPTDPTLAPTAADSARANKQAHDEKEQALRAIQEMKNAAAKTAAEDGTQSLPAAKLYVVSEPLGASVTAAWNGKSATGQTPFVFKVRRGAQVTVTLSKAGYAPAVQQVQANVAQAVVVTLKVESGAP